MQNGEINWEELGVFTSRTTFNELLVVYILATLLFTVLYFLNKMYFPEIIMALCGESSPYF